jgi:predicted ATPase
MPTNALDYITIQGFKSIASIEKLELRPINVVIGPNGSGKSNFIGVFAFLHAIREGRLRDYVTTAGGAEKVLHFGSKTTRTIRLHLSFKNEVNQYEVTLSPTDDDGLYPSSETVMYWVKAKYEKPYDTFLSARDQGREAGISSPKLERIARWVSDRLGSWRIYHLHDTSSSSPMRKTAKVDDNDYLRSDGSNLAAFLYFLREEHEPSYSLIQRAVQRVTPFFDDFRLRPRKLHSDDIQLEWRHKKSDQYFGASSLSDGTLRFIALATLFLQPESYRPSVILMDEPELGLHPYAIEMLAALIRQASVTTQVIVSTQSSLLLDHFEPQDVLVANRVDGGTQLTRLESPRLANWLEDYSLGQLWEKKRAWWKARSRLTLMARLLIHVEGQTEEDFVNEVLRNHLVSRGYHSVDGRIVGNARLCQRRGGVRPWPSVRKDIISHLREDQECIATTMVDYYGLPQTWPGKERAKSMRAIDKMALCVQDALRDDVVRKMGDRFDSDRFVPFVVMHEFEGLLFSDAPPSAEASVAPILRSAFDKFERTLQRRRRSMIHPLQPRPNA